MYAFIELLFGKLYWDKLIAQFQSQCYLITMQLTISGLLKNNIHLEWTL